MVKKALLSGLILVGLTNLDAKAFPSAEAELRLGYSVWDGYAKTQFTDSSALSLLGTDSFTYETNNFDNTWQFNARVQTDVLGWYMEGNVFEFTIKKTKLLGLAVKYNYSFERGSVGFSKKWESGKITFRLGGGVRVVQLGVDKKVGEPPISFVISDKEKFTMPEARFIAYYDLNRWQFKVLTSAGIHKDYKTFSTGMQIGYKLTDLYGFSFGVQQEYVKIESKKNKADINLIMPYIAMDIYMN